MTIMFFFFFKGKIKLKFCPSLKIWKRIILRFREVHSRTFYDIYASLGRGQEMRAFWTWPLFLPSVSWGLAKGFCHLRTPWNPCPQAPLLTAPLTLFLHKSTYKKKIPFHQINSSDDFICIGLTMCIHRHNLKY